MSSETGTATVGSFLRRHTVFAAVAVVAAGLLLAAYSNHFENGFHFDDAHVLLDNLHVRNVERIPRFFVDATTFSSLPVNATYRPLLTTTFAIDYWLAGGYDPWQFHVTQFIMLVCLGAGATYLFYRVGNDAAPRWWNRYVALLAATWFCAHTANAETVNYISARSDLLSTLGVVLAFCTYLVAGPARGRYWCVVPMAAGALVKSPAVIFAPLLLGYVLLFEERLSVTDLCRRATWPRLWLGCLRALPAFAVGMAMFLFVERMNPPTLTYSTDARLPYLLTQPFVWLEYLRVFFVPLGLTADTDWDLLPHWYDTRLFAGLLGIGLLVWIGGRATRANLTRPVAFGIFWFGMALLPTSSVFPLAEVTNGHRAFFAYLGLTLAVVWGGRLLTERWIERWPRVAAATTGLVVVSALTGHAYGTHARNRVWLNDETLWADVTEKSPNNGRGWMNYGLSQMSRGRYELAKRLYDRAAVLTPNYSVLETNLAIVTDRLGDPAQAEQHFKRALELTPNYAAGHYFFGNWLVEQGRAAEGIPLLNRSVELSPGYAPPRRALMNLYYAGGDEERLRAVVESTLLVSPGDPTANAYLRGGTPVTSATGDALAHWERGLAFTSQGRHLDAALAYRHAILAGPPTADALNNLGYSLIEVGLFAEAVPPLERAVELRPAFERAVNNLAWARGRLAGQ